MNRPFARALLASAAVAVATALAGCDADSIAPLARSQAPISEKTLADIESKRMDKDSPILIRIFKEEAEMEVWKKNREGEFALLKTYPICRWSGDLGPKVKEGDRQAPEGFYTITPGQMNPNSNYYLAFNTGYPNTYDRAWNRTGSELMVHGDCSSRGCYAMTDEQMQEIYSLARESFFGGQKSFQLQAFPFRMTALNMAKHRNNANFAFWTMIKEGYDHFEATHQEPKVAVCEKRYVFDAVPRQNASRALSFNARGACPTFQLDPTIATAVLDYRRNEQFQMAQYIAKGVEVVPSRAGIDGGMNPVFEAKLATQEGYDSNGRLVRVAAAPGSLPRKNNRPPTTVVLPQAVEQPVVTASMSSGETTQQSGSSGGLFGNLFGGAPEQTASVPATASEPLALRGTSTDVPAKPRHVAPVRTASVPAAPARKPHEAAPVRAPEARVAERAPAPAPVPMQTPPAQQARAAAPAPAPEPEMRTAFSAAPPPPANIAGAQPVVPANTFESRWTALR